MAVNKMSPVEVRSTRSYSQSAEDMSGLRRWLYDSVVAGFLTVVAFQRMCGLELVPSKAGYEVHTTTSTHARCVPFKS